MKFPRSVTPFLLALAAAPLSASAAPDAPLAARDIKVEIVTVTITVGGGGTQPSPIIAAVPSVPPSSAKASITSAPAAIPSKESTPGPVGGNAPVPAFKGGNQINLINNYASTVYVNWNATNHAIPEAFPLAAGASRAVTVETLWAGAGFVGLQMGHTANSKFEFRFQGLENKHTTFFDVDVEYGSSVPLICEPPESDVFSGCTVDKLAACPANLVSNSPSGQKVACRNDRSEAAKAFFYQGCSDWFVTSHEQQSGKAQTKSTKSIMINCYVGGKGASKKARALQSLDERGLPESSSEPLAAPARLARHLHQHAHAHRRALTLVFES
ncbi:MAG: hypothetical protein M1814_005781 [Vezdaea aestivalis]|nr:MAG: hypothetical protein M1814_005781 [Vezdaea aestivalis]